MENLHKADRTFFEQLSQRLGEATTKRCVVCANKRQVRFIRDGLFTTPAPRDGLIEIIDLNAWVSQQYLHHQTHFIDGFESILLDAFAGKNLWAHIIESDDTVPPLVNIKQLQEQCQQASDIRRQHQISREAIQELETDDSALFIQLEAQYFDALKQLGAVDNTGACQRLLLHAQNSGHRSDEQLYLYGFAELSPLHNAILQGYSRDELAIINEPQINQTIESSLSTTQSNEFETAAQWARQIIAQDDSGSIAVVIPELHRYKSQVEQIFIKALEPQAFLHDESQTIPRLFDISASSTLAEQSIAQDIIPLIELTEPYIARKSALQLFNSEYWGTGFNACGAAVINAIENHYKDYLSCAGLFDIYASSEYDHQEQEAQAISALMATRSMGQHNKKTRFCSEWVQWLMELLEKSSWPGPRTLHSAEYQQVQTLLSSLDAFTANGNLLYGKINLRHFKRLLEQHLLSTMSHVEVAAPRVHILGLMEASGLSFDHCFVCNLNENVLPEPAAPIALLPTVLQRQYNTPKSSPERELLYAKKLLKGLINTSSHVVLSYSSEDDAGELLPSPLITEYLESAPVKTTVLQRDRIKQYLMKQTSWNDFISVPCGKAPEIPLGDHIPGGSYHLNLFTINPIYAFFRYRLGIETPQRVSLGVTAADRGSILHLSLANLYRQFQEQTDIVDFMNREDAHACIDHYVSAAMKNNPSQASAYKLIFEYEKKCLKERIWQILTLDKKRMASFGIYATEKSEELHLQGRTIKLRVDRIDALSDGYLIIDYKNSAPSLTNLVKQHINDFQLPLYTLSFPPEQVQAVSYLEASEQAAKFSGLGDNTLNIPGILSPHKVRSSELNEHWQDSLKHWRSNIDNCTAKIIDGEANCHLTMASKAQYYQDYHRAIRDHEWEESNA